VLALSLSDLLGRGGERIGVFGGRPYTGRHVAYRIAEDHPGLQAVVGSLRAVYGVEPWVIGMGGSVPIWAFTDILGLPTLVLPYANANNRQHSPNEHLRLDHLFQGIRTTAGLLTDLA